MLLAKQKKDANLCCSESDGTYDDRHTPVEYSETVSLSQGLEARTTLKAGSDAADSSKE